jgi:hypothetical protein
MDKYYLVGRNILDFLFISYNCFSNNCPGKIVVSLNTLRKNTRIQCPICKREDTLYLQTDWLNAVQRYFDYVYRQLRELELLPLVFSTAISPKNVFLDSVQPNNTQLHLYDSLGD